MAEASPPPCPICGKPRAERFRPFCSSLCRDKDLIAWTTGRYAIPAALPDDEDEEGPEPPRGAESR